MRTGVLLLGVTLGCVEGQGNGVVPYAEDVEPGDGPGSSVWTRMIEGQTLTARDLASDPAGAAIVVGSYREWADFGDGAAEGDGGFVAKFDRGGELVWVRREAAEMRRVASDPRGNVVVAAEGALTALAPDGSVAWTSSIDDLTVQDVATADDGRVVVVGRDRAGATRLLRLASGGAIELSRSLAIGKEVELSPLFVGVGADGALVVAGTAQTGGMRGFVATFDAGGAPRGTRFYAADSAVSRLDVAPDGGFTVAGGDASGGFVAAFGPTGEARWTRRLEGTAALTATGLAVDRDGNVAVAFAARAELAWVDGEEFERSGSVVLGRTRFAIAPGTTSMILARLSSRDGAPLWTRRYGDNGNQVEPAALAVSPNGRILVAGALHGTVDFGAEAVTRPVALFLTRFVP